MRKKIFEFLFEWSFSFWGNTIWCAAVSIVMAVLTFLTNALKNYSPLSYGVTIVFGIITTLIILRLLLSIFVTFNQRVATKKPTFVEYKIHNRRMTLVKKSNIYQEPSTTLMDPTLTPSTQQQATVPNSCLSLTVLATFEKPIASISMHLKIEQISGQCPTIDGSNTTERWAQVRINNIHDECYFRIWFNDIAE
ncbi:MAG: hypothetical protein V4496_05725 [Pseudomonadota bacterium]